MTLADEKVTVRAIVEAVASYVDGKSTLIQFEDWFIPSAWKQGAKATTKTSTLANEIYLRIAEYDRGHLDEDGLRTLLQEAVQKARKPAASRPAQ
jgi:hypothetical protein